MASFSSFLAKFVIFMAYFSSLALTSEVLHVQYSTISAAPALLPEPPFSSTSPPPTSSLSPDIEPVFPTTGAAVPSPAESSLPTIPSSPSPPNPDIIDPEAPGPVFGISPSGSLPASSATSLTSSAILCLALHFLGLMVFCLEQLSA
ncbi:classical arabinogalactan protein 26 [Ricinus communis]|uniref:classical arabinogalactan protein 26 n=1 Tax=Ricinus communis TaxID=3988 RepID=UPI00201AB5B8|nr:classical arabinogalactan protein 26 [Ricinus communis]